MKQLCLLLLAAGLSQAQQNDNVQVHILPVQGSVYMLIGGGANTTLQVGKDGVAVVDTQVADMASKVVTAIRTLSPMPIRYIVNTDASADHAGGNAALVKLAGAMPRIIANDHVLNRMSLRPPGGQPAFAEADWPNDEYFAPTKDFFFNNEAVVVYHMPAAHTDGDSIVFFRRSDVLSVGNIFTPDTYPVIDVAKGGTVQGEIDALNRILELTVPAKYQEGGTYVIPGRGRLCEEADVVEYRDMVTIIRDRIQDLMRKGKTLAQVKAARPTLDYDTQYGATSGSWNTDMFIEAIYKSLGGK